MPPDESLHDLAGLLAQPFDPARLGRALSLIEVLGPRVFQLAPLLRPARLALRVGVTGPPGAGKSTLIGQLIRELRAQGLFVGVIAVDPSSPFSQGAILGDRIRYADHSADTKVFIRSLGTRGSLGGLSAAAYLMLRAFDHFSFDVVLVETVGVGQTELEIVNVADAICVVLVPESGDSIQAMKAGLMEIADLFIVNKADRPGAEALQLEIKAATEMGHWRQTQTGQAPHVMATTATMGQGVSTLTQQIGEWRRTIDTRALRQTPQRLRAEAHALLRHDAEKSILAQVQKINSAQDFQDVFNSLQF